MYTLPGKLYSTLTFWKSNFIAYTFSRKYLIDCDIMLNSSNISYIAILAHLSMFMVVTTYIAANVM